MDYPKDRRKNLEWRRNLLIRCKEDLGYRAVIKELFHRDPLFAFNAFFYTYDPRKRGDSPHLPFITWDYEDELILELVRAIAEGEDYIIEKSRDMGATWTVCGVLEWEWLKPSGGSDFLMGSRIEDYVDKRGDPRALFHKNRYLTKKLPSWLQPSGFHPAKHDNHMKLVNPETGSVIAGESNNANFSTGGRYAAVFFDEFAKWESTDESAWMAAGDATPCRIAASTPFGAAGQYYSLVTDGKTKRKTLHWSLHPEKSKGLSCVWPPPNDDDRGRLGDHWSPEVKLTSPWYEKETQRRRPTEIAQELDIDYIGAGNPVFDGKAAASLAYYHKVPDKPIWWGKILLEEMKLERLEREPFDWEGHLVVYADYDPKHYYTVGWDVVEGVEGGDYASGTVLDRITKDVVAVYWSRIDEVMLSRVVKVIQDYYAPEPESPDAPWCGIETTGPGLATFDFALTLGVTNLFMSPRYDTTKGGVSYKKGWRTDTNSRNELVAGVRSYLIDRAGQLNSQRLVGELLTFVRSRTGKPQAKEGTHDDMVLSFGIALQVDELAPLPYEDAKETKKEELSESREINREEHRIDEDLTLEGRCLASLRAMQQEYSDDALFGEY